MDIIYNFADKFNNLEDTEIFCKTQTIKAKWIEFLVMKKKKSSHEENSGAGWLY